MTLFRWLPVVLGTVFICLAVAIILVDLEREDRALRQQVAACERGNALRVHVSRLEAQAADGLYPPEPILRPFPCGTLR